MSSTLTLEDIPIDAHVRVTAGEGRIQILDSSLNLSTSSSASRTSRQSSVSIANARLNLRQANEGTPQALGRRLAQISLPSSSSAASTPTPAPRQRSAVILNQPSTSRAQPGATSAAEGSLSRPTPGAAAETSSRPTSRASVLSATSRPRSPDQPQNEQAAKPIPNTNPESLPPEPPSLSRAQVRELEDLRIKVKVLESRRQEDADRMRILDAKAFEAENFMAARAKLQERFAILQSELGSLRSHAKSLELAKAEIETHEEELNAQLEMAALDREVAEEKAEQAAHELEELKEQCEILKTENEVLKDENAEYGKPIEGEKMAYIQLEKQNERLKEALMRLRDVSAETERELKSRIAELERQAGRSEESKGRIAALSQQLAQADLQVEHLKTQLDAALGAEELLEQLTERTLDMGERIEEMRITIEDLEALKEMNDQLEENHIENEKQLEAEIDLLTHQLSVEHESAVRLAETVADREATISQFRDLVGALQHEMAKRDDQPSEAVVKDLHTKMVSMSESQARHIDIDVLQCDLVAARRRLELTSAYLTLPAEDASAIDCFLRLSGIIERTSVLERALALRHELPHALESASDESLVEVCELRGRLISLVNQLRYVAASIRHGSAVHFIQSRRISKDVQSLETRVEDWISRVRRNDIQESQWSQIIIQCNETAERMGELFEEDLSARQLALASRFDYDLDNFAAAIGFARQRVHSIESETDLTEAIDEPVSRILTQVKLVKSLALEWNACASEIATQDKALPNALLSSAKMIVTSVSQATDLAVKLAQAVSSHVDSLAAESSVLAVSDVLSLLSTVAAEVAPQTKADPWDLIGAFVTRLSNDLASFLPKLKTAMPQDLVDLSCPEPWAVRAAELTQQTTAGVDAQKSVAEQRNEILRLTRELQSREKRLEEANVKYEILNKKWENAQVQMVKSAGKDAQLEETQRQEQLLRDALVRLKEEMANLTLENSRLRSSVTEQPSHRADQLISTSQNAGKMHRRLEAVASAVQQLRRENMQLKAHAVFPGLSQLTGVYSPPSSTSSSASSDSGSASAPRTPSPTASKLLWRELARAQASTEVIDLTTFSGSWQPTQDLPEVRYVQQRQKRRDLEDRVRDYVAGVKLI